MSAPLFVTKGEPYSFFLSLSEGNTDFNLNDGNWTVTAKLRFQTNTGPEPFVVNYTTISDGILVEFTAEQTALLNHRGTGYIAIFKLDYQSGAKVVINEFLVSVSNAII